MNLVLIDDHPLFSAGLKSILEQEVDIEHVEIFDGNDLDTIHRYIFKQTPDLVLLDIHLGKVDGLKLGEQLMNRLPGIRLLFLTGNDYPEYRRIAAGIKAKGFLSKSLNPIDLAERLRKVERGEELEISDSPTKQILTAQELETLQLVCEGKANSSIAEEFGVTERAIDYRIKGIKKKLDVSSTKQAVITAVKLGLVRMHN